MAMNSRDSVISSDTPYSDSLESAIVASVDDETTAHTTNLVYTSIRVINPPDKAATSPFMDPATQRLIPEAHSAQSGNCPDAEHSAPQSAAHELQRESAHSLDLPPAFSRSESRFPDDDEIMNDDKLREALIAQGAARSHWAVDAPMD